MLFYFFPLLISKGVFKKDICTPLLLKPIHEAIPVIHLQSYSLSSCNHSISLVTFDYKKV